MKPFISRTILMLAFGLTLAADGATPSVNLDVKIEGKADYKGSSTKTQSRTLSIKIENYGVDTVPDVKVKWWLFGHNMKGHDLIILKQGESKVVMPAKGITEVASSEIDATGTREHKVTSRKGGGRRGRTSTQTVPASGQEYNGYAVEVYSGNTQIAAEYSNPNIKKNLHPSKD